MFPLLSEAPLSEAEIMVTKYRYRRRETNEVRKDGQRVARYEKIKAGRVIKTFMMTPGDVFEMKEVLDEEVKE